jgi:Asp/Glu/hydantoin racemase
LIDEEHLAAASGYLPSLPPKGLFQRIEGKIDAITGRKIRRGTYGQAVGILVLDTDFPRIPGDIGNATTYPFPVRFKVVKGMRHEDIVCGEPDISVCRRFIEEAKELEGEGVRAVTTSCGYFCYFQDEIADALDIPVFTSSLIQVPLVAKMLGKNNRVGIVCGNSKALTKTHLKKAGIDDSIRVAVAGLDENWDLINDLGPRARLEGFEKGLSKVAQELVTRHSDIGAFVFECTNFPPGAAAVQEATGLPVFDIVTLVYMIHDAVVRKRYSGYL